MRPGPFQDPLQSCIVSAPTRWTGRLKLEFCPTDGQFQRLKEIPGVLPWENTKKQDETGWYVPRSLLDMGKLPATLAEYPPEPNAITPSGLVLHVYEARAVTCVRQLTSEREGMILAGDPGLGKSLISLHSLYLDGFLSRPGLIIGPNIAKGVWCDDDSDAFLHYGLRIQSLEGVKDLDVEVLKQHTAFFCHYELLHAWQRWIVDSFKPAWLLIDESHYLCNQKAQRSEAARQIALLASIERRIALTGTPIPNARLELWNQLAVVQPRQWGPSAFSFGLRHCNGHRTEVDEGGQGGNWVFDGESNDIELKARLAGSFLRFTTDEVENELPKLNRHVIEAKCVDAKLDDDYSLAQRDIGRYIKMNTSVPKELKTLKIGNIEVPLGREDRKPGAARLVCLSTLIGILSKMKQVPALQAIEQILQKHNRLVVFTWRVATAEWICEQLLDTLARGGSVGDKKPLVFGPVHGELPMSKRKALAKAFAGSPCAIYVATMGAAGTSINSLSAASSALIVDLHWNTAALMQAEKRVHRDGSTAEEVDIYYLVLRSTVDDLFLQKLEEKAKKAASLAPNDIGGVSLVRDLSPSGASGGVDLDDLCAQLMSMA